MSENPHRGQCDPGWNDPPKLQYQGNATGGGGKTKLNLNKRIAFPLQQGNSVAATSKPTAIVQPSPSVLPFVTTTTITTSISQPPVAIVQPLMSSQTQLPPMRVPTIPVDDYNTESDNIADISNQEDIRDYCLNTFQTHLSNVDETSIVRRDEVQRRINLLSQMWLNNTLNISVHRKLLNIAKALDSRDFNEAMENHRALVVDHSNICISWASALRQIILTIQVPTLSTTATYNAELTSNIPVVTSTQTVVINPFNNILIPTTNNSISDNSGIEENQTESATTTTSNVQHL